jgi:BNR/Asp-box repeat
VKKPFAAVCGGLLLAAFAAGCGTTQTPAAAAPAGVMQPPDGLVPAGFRAASATFVSTREAFVLGTSPCSHAPCTWLARTLDRGMSWHRLPAPVVPVGEPDTSTGPAVWGIRFATPEHGFVFGDGLWVTADGGEHWSTLGHPGGAIVSLEIIDHQVLAVIARHGADGPTGWTLWRRAVSGGPWVRIAGLASSPGTGGIATQAGVAAVVDGSSVMVSTDGGVTVTRHQTPCRAAGSPFPVVTSVTAEAPRGLALLCAGQGYTGHTDKTVYVSGDLGATWKLAGHPGSAGDGGTIAASAPWHLTIATTSAASWLYYSADNGKTWRTAVTYPDGGQGWNDLGFTSVRDGVVIHGHPYYGDQLGQLLLTDNGGLTWHAVTFRNT